MKWMVLILLMCALGCYNNQSTEHNTEDKKEELGIVKQSIPVSPPKKGFTDNLNAFIKTYLSEFDTSFYKNETAREGFILNQTNFIWVKKLQFKKKQSYKDSQGKKYYKRFELIAYEYPDSSSCDKAFELWLSNFGTMGIPIKRYEFIEGFHSGPTYVVLTNKQITSVFMASTYTEGHWKRIKKDLVASIDTAGNLVETLECGILGPITWERLKSNKQTLPSGALGGD